MAFFRFNHIIKAFIDFVLKVVGLLYALGHEWLNPWREKRNLFIKSLTPSIKVSSIIVPLSCWEIDSHTDKSHLEFSLIVFFLFKLDDCGFDPLASIILRVNLVINLESILPFPVFFGLSLERSQLDRPSIYHPVGFLWFSWKFKEQRICLNATNQCLGPSSPALCTSSIIVMNHSINLVALFQVLSPGLPRTLCVQSLQLLFRNQKVEFVQSAVEIKHLPTCK
jgi:hypothetical protein